MNITDVKVVLRNEDSLKAFVNIIIDNAFIIKNIKVIEGKNGLFVSMPSLRSKNGEFRDIAHPINTETRDMIEKIIFDKYNETVKSE
jgi:stage V sporulation protein G